MKKIISIALCVALLAGTLAVGLGSFPLGLKAAAADEYSDAYKSIVENTPVPAEFTAKDDPYGYGVNVPFTLNTKEELLHIKTFGSSASFTSYDNLTAKNSTTYPESGATATSVGNISNKLSHIQTVAFDANGNGKKDHVAVIGVNMQKNVEGGSNDYGAIYMYVFDKSGRQSNVLKLGNARWLGSNYILNNDNMYDFNAMNFFGVTAGDYNGDDHETLVVWGAYGPADNTNNAGSPHYTLSEITVDLTKNPIKIGIKENSSNRSLLHPNYSHVTGDHVDNRLHCALDSGDVNNDGFDDLVVLSYVGRMKEDSDRKKSTKMYVPYLAVSYGFDTVDFIIAGTTKKTTYITESSGNTHTTCCAPGVAVGNVNKDGYKEIVIAGPSRIVTGSWSGNATESDNISNTTMRYWIYGVDQTNSLSKLYYGSRTANKWTTGGNVYGGLHFANGGEGDQSWQRTGVETVAVNGGCKPEMIFVNGSLFAFDASQAADEAKFRSVFTGDYFNKADEGVGDIVPEETYIRSMAVGNFDNNNYGFEQIVYTIGAADANAVGDAIFFTGMIGGVHAGNADASDYFCTSENTMSSSLYPDNNGGDCRLDDCNNYVVCAWDNDNDNLRVRYKTKTFEYADPEVMAVLQAPPFFPEMRGYAENEIAYSISETIGGETTSSNGTSFGVGVTQSLEGTLGGYEVSAGYATDWTEEFSEGWEEAKTYSFYTKYKDQVIVRRTPVILYVYEVETNGDFNGESLVLSFPCKSMTNQISVEAYNTFVQEYNAKLPSNAKAEAFLTPLEDEYLGHSGDPYAYLKSDSIPTSVKVLQDDSKAVEVAEGTGTGFSYEYSVSQGHSEEMSHGFSFELEISFGIDIPMFVSASVGAKTSLEYTSSHSYSTTQTDGTAVEVSMDNYDKNDLIADGIDLTTANQYTFNYQLVRWNSGIPSKEIVDDENTEPRDVYTYGFALSGLKETLPVVDNLNATFITTDEGNRAIKLTWDAPDKTNHPYEAFTIYEYYPNGEKQEVVTLDSTKTEFIYEGYAARPDFEFTIVTKPGEYDTLESMESEKAHLYTIAATAVSDIALTSSENDIDTYTISYTDGTTSTFTVQHANTITSFDKTDVNGSQETYTISYSDGTTKTYTVDLAQVCDGNHDYIEFAVDPSCCASGFSFKFCRVCGDRTFSLADPTGHSYTETVVAPTHDTCGYTRYVCDNCGDTYCDNLTAITAHTYTEKVVEPTCVESGYTEKTCSECGIVIRTDIVPANGHSYTGTVTEPTCSHFGYTTYKCANCDSEYVSDVTPTVAHNFTSKVIKNTCCSEGYTIKYCADCGFSVIEDETDAKGHKFEVTNVFAPTCSTTGYSIYTCSECGVNYIDDITETTAHTPGEWVCEDPATGRYVKRCENCYKLLDTKTVSIVGGNGDGEGEGSEGSGGSNSLNPNIDENGVLNIGYQETEKVTLKADGIDTSTVVYTSSDPKVATVDEDGNITAVGPGDAVITASIPGTAITTSVPVNVKLTWWQKIHYILNTSTLFRIIFVIFKIPAFDGLPL